MILGVSKKYGADQTGDNLVWSVAREIRSARPIRLVHTKPNQLFSLSFIPKSYILKLSSVALAQPQIGILT